MRHINARRIVPFPRLACCIAFGVTRFDHGGLLNRVGGGNIVVFSLPGRV
jgi:hypothetical protein